MKVLLSFSILVTLLMNFTALAGSEEGTASYYADSLHGNATASGELYDSQAMTAAHPTLPFDTNVKVINLENNKSVIVRINDRGPYTKNRIIDLSKAAAQKIGMLDSGTATVRLEQQ